MGQVLASSDIESVACSSTKFAILKRNTVKLVDVGVTANFVDICYSSNRNEFIAIATEHNQFVYSKDGGENLGQQKTFPVVDCKKIIPCKDGYFVILNGNTNQALFALKGRTFEIIELPLTKEWADVAIDNNNKNDYDTKKMMIQMLLYNP